MNLKALNRAMYMAAQHLYEAAMHVQPISEEYAARLLAEAEQIASAVELEEEKVSQERLDEVLSEILSVDLES